MKTIRSLVFLCILSVAAFGTSSAQIYYMELSIQNLQQLTPNSFEFEIWVKNLNPNDTVRLSFVQFGFDIPNYIANGGIMTITKTAWDPQFNGTTLGSTGNPQIIGQPANPHIAVPSITTTFNQTIVLPTTGNGIMYGRYVVQNTAPFLTNGYLYFVINKNSVIPKARTVTSGYLKDTNGTYLPYGYFYPNSTPILDTIHFLDSPPTPTLILNPGTTICPTYAQTVITSPTCYGGSGSVAIDLLAPPTTASGTYQINGVLSGTYTGNAFNISGLATGTQTITVLNDPGCPALTIPVTIASPPALVPAWNNLNLPSCLPGCDGTATLYTVGAQPPLVYSLSGPATLTNNTNLNTLCSGSTFTVQVVDAIGCTGTQSFTVPSPPLNFSNNVSSCNSYYWPMNGQTYTQSGTYSTTSTNPLNNCVENHSIQLTIQNGSNSTINISSPPPYFWNCTNTTYSQSGIYPCYSINAFGCPDTQLLHLTICTLAVNAPNVTTCENVPVTLAGSPSGGSYSVSNPYTGPSTAYTYVYTDAATGCTDSAVGYIDVLLPVSVTAVYANSIHAQYANIIWQAAQGAIGYEIQYQISGSGNWITAGTVNAPTLSFTLTGLNPMTTYDVRVRGYCDLSVPFPWSNVYTFTTAPAGMESPRETYGLHLFPNPTKHAVTIESSGGGMIQEVQILDISGRICIQSHPLSTSSVIPITSLSEGMYETRVLMDNQRWYSMRLLVHP